MAAAVFLEINGRRLVASESEAARVFVDLAAGKVTEPELAAWLEQNLAAE